ncbi:MAG: arsenite efflux transporter metallochaperone ArsD [Planctomycetaceae bacterium]|nr:arsenite efflux transporter metallochaperone ArsD [Planctomycetaceae bacterium]
MDNQSILTAVQDQYGAVARSGLSNESEAVQAVAKAFGYTSEELASLPPEANMGLSCGNPVAVAGLREGEVVVDLGSGGGLDVFLAAQRVGPTGKAIGIDMTPDMIDRAKAGAALAGVTNVEFYLAQIDRLPLADASVDCIISNCVINLVPDKSQAFREILRVLKPGGRMVISDIALKQPLPDSVLQDVQAYVGCIAGAMQIVEYESLLRAAGFGAVVVQDTGADLNAYAQAGADGLCPSSSCCSATPAPITTTSVHEGLAKVLGQFDANEFAASVRVQALKPLSELQLAQGKVETNMKTIQVYDKPMCCSTGVCGPQVDPVLPRFAADLQWLQSQGHCVERFNLAQQPAAFIENPEVHQLLATQGTDCLPLIAVNGHIVSRRGYPAREMLALWTTGDQNSPAQPSTMSSGGCCGGSVQNSTDACCVADEQAKAESKVGCGCDDSHCC